jgi:DNA-binding transcriptional ArsR family regulator
MNKGYYAIIPANVRYDKSLTPNAKLLYGEITALCNEKGYCWAGNDYFAGLYDVSKTSISKWISALRDCGYINIQLEYAEGTKQILNRYITLVKDPIEEKLNTPLRKVKDPIEEKLIVNNTVNNTSNTTSNKGRFTPPTLDEVIEQCNRTGASIDPQGFIDFYESKGWMIGKNKMKCWKAAIRTWSRKEREKKQVQPVNQPVKQKREPTGLRGRSITDSLTDRSWAD